MNRNTIIIITICAFLVIGIWLWHSKSPYIQQPKALMQSVVYKDRINQMFTQNMALINRILKICETTTKENMAANEIVKVLDNYQKLLDQYSSLVDQRLGFDNEFGADWAGTIKDQWMHLIYTLDTKYQSNPKAIYAIAKDIILKNTNIDSKSLHEHIIAMTFTKEIKPENKQAQTKK